LAGLWDGTGSPAWQEPRPYRRGPVVDSSVTGFPLKGAHRHRTLSFVRMSVGFRNGLGDIASTLAVIFLDHRGPGAV
jgi:hypothetical protein